MSCLIANTDWMLNVKYISQPFMSVDALHLHNNKSSSSSHFIDEQDQAWKGYVLIQDNTFPRCLVWEMNRRPGFAKAPGSLISALHHPPLKSCSSHGEWNSYHGFQGLDDLVPALLVFCHCPVPELTMLRHTSLLVIASVCPALPAPSTFAPVGSVMCLLPSPSFTCLAV